MRGKAFPPFQTSFAPGITPAYAGKRTCKTQSLAATWDHPRVCGEKVCLRRRLRMPVGSPPRMRGKAGFLRASSFLTGITPAYAGKSESIDVQAEIERDHPRVCGEKLSCPARGRHHKGSPPRMRGKALFYRFALGLLGITPAYAGKRLKRSHSIGHFSCILCLFHSVLHRASASGGSRAGPCAPPCLPAQNAVPV